MVIKSDFSRKFLKKTEELQKFLIIGGVSTLINYGVFFLLFEYVRLNHIVSASIGYLTGLVFGYFFNRTWTFKSENNSKKKEFGSYFFVYMISLILSMSLLELLVKLGIDPRLGNIAAIALSTISNFIGCKFLVFKK